jgi:hypothetical protein
MLRASRRLEILLHALYGVHPMQTRVRTLMAVVLGLASLGAITERVRDPGVTNTEIRIGNVMPYSGSLDVFGVFRDDQRARRDQWPQGALHLI